ncbi:MAG TPA: FAD-dependent oxidoreductase [Thermodesulfobacteriota bacterium]|nr:FAD-dependent oxidoreductase [Thermodesulfobacteriota bacterium]
MKKPNVLILGCGVSGLSCGISLLERNFSVTIVAHTLPPNTTSNAAGAIWFPYKSYPEGRVLGWGRFSFNEYLKLKEIAGTGVSFIKLILPFEHKVIDPEWKDIVHNFHRISQEELPQGYSDGYVVEVPIIETPVYVQYLMKRFTGLGGKVQKTDKEISELSELYPDKKLIVNCSGLGARKICGDKEVYPIRGQVVRTSNPGIKRSIIIEDGPLALSYIMPRGKDCILGGTAEENEWSLEINPDTAQEILNKCQQLEPSLRNADILEHKVGLRPGRKEVRLELEQVSAECAVIHNYGHGGAGFTLSWGCAEEVAELAERFYMESA